MTLQAPAPQVEIGYAQAVNYNWWLYENETTPELIWPQSTFVFDSMRRTDSQVTSVLRAMTLPVRRTPWRIDPNGAKPKVVQFVADDLGLPVVGEKVHKPPPRSKDRFSWPDHLRQALLMLSYGHMYFEQVYRVEPDGSAAHLRKLGPRMPKTIERIDVAADGGLIGIKQYWSSTSNGLQTIPVNRLVAYIHEREGGNWLGTSILRPAYKNWLLKDRLLRVQAQTIERNGMGIPLYKAAEGATEMATGLAMAKAWRAGDAAGSAVPFGADLILRGVEGTLPDAEPAVRYHDEQIGRAVLAHFLNLGTQTGSWALGTTFADFFTLSLQTLADQVADTATQHIVEDLVDINFGPDEPAPRIVCDEIGSRQAATAEALRGLVMSGIIHPDEVLEESTRQQYGLPPKDPNAPKIPPPLPSMVRENLTGQAPGTLPLHPGTAPTADAGAADASAAVAAMQGVAASAASELLGEDIDEQADTITAALDEWVDSQLPAEVEAKYNPDELRIPGGHGGGRWTKNPIGKAISDALDAWGKGKGPDDPFTFDGKPIDREPLRKAAVARGITLKRGASRDDIVKALLGGVKDEVVAARTERQKRRSGAKFSIDVGGTVDAKAAREVAVQNDIRSAYAKLKGRTDLPKSDRVYGHGDKQVSLHDAFREQGKVFLTDLRDALGDKYSREEIDKALTDLAVHDPSVRITPVHASQVLTEPDRAAALKMGGENHHLLEIGDTTPRPMPRPVGGKRVDVAVYTGTDPNAPTLREITSANRPGRTITSQPDLAGLEKWANDNGHTDVADWAKSERARAEAKNAPRTHPTDTGGRITEAEAWKRLHGDKPMPTKAPAKKAATKAVKAVPKAPSEPKVAAKRAPKAAKAAPTVDRTPLSPADRAHHIVADASLTDRQKRTRLKSMGLAQEDVDRLVPTKAAAAKATKSATKKATPSAPHPDGLDSTPRAPHLRTTEPPVTSSSTRIVPTPTPPNPQSPWGKVRDRPTMTWSETHGRPGPLDQVDRVYTAPTREDARKFLASMDDTRLQDVADQVEDIINVKGMTAERNRDALIDRLVDGIREPEVPAGGARPKGEGGAVPAADFEARVAAAQSGSSAERLPPVRVTVDASAGADVGKWKAVQAEGFTGPQSSLLSAVNRRVRVSGPFNERLRFPEGKPLQGWEVKYRESLPPEEQAKLDAARAREFATADRDIKVLDRAMAQSKLPDDAVVYRGGRNAARLGLPDGDSAVGVEWTDAAYVGTSTDSEVAKDFIGGRGGYLARILAPKGTSAIRITGGGESELMLDRGLTFRVVADRGVTKGGTRLIDVEIVPAEAPTAIRSSAPGEPHHWRHGWIPVDDLESLSDDELLDHFHQLSQADVPDEAALHALDAELARRESAPFDSPESRRVDDLVAKGHGYLDAYAEVHGLDVAQLELEQRMQRVNQERRPGESRAQTIRRMHAEHVAVAVLQAEDDTHGNLLNREGRAAGIDPATLWSGPTARARKYASDELKQWWSEHGGRMTAAQWAAQFTGDTKAAEAARLAGQGKDFGV